MVCADVAAACMFTGELTGAPFDGVLMLTATPWGATLTFNVWSPYAPDGIPGSNDDRVLT